MPQPPSSSLLLLSWLLLSLVQQTSCLPWTYRKCHQSSCGNLQIKHPFYLKSDEERCNTEPQYELNCKGNKTVLQIFQPEKYVVTKITPTYINVLSERFAEGSCTVPTVSPSPKLLKETYSAVMSWGSLVKCREAIINDTSYLPVNCMSANGSFVYLATGFVTYEVLYLKPSCSYLAMFPLLGFLPDNSTGDAFGLLQQGFSLYYTGQKPMSWIQTILLIAKSIGQFLLERMLLIRVFLMPPTIFVFLLYLLLKSKISTDVVEKFLRNQESLTPTRYAYTDIIRITGNFRKKLGQGGFGSVFKGVLPGGTLVAVKMLSNSSFNGDDFINEVSTLGTIHHFNVVRLIGFCSEGSKRALIYEYMPNSSLDKFIFAATGKKIGHRTFTLAKLNEIALGIARGIEYLHRGCDMQILHFDIKPNNILLDINLTPKIADFGLAKLYPKGHSLLSVSAARGTIGYMAPELISMTFGPISHKSDVYSFGMLLMEMVGGRRNIDHNIDQLSRVYYPSWIYDKLIEEQQNSETNISLDISEVEKKLSIVALWCIQIKSSDRPDMSRVIEMLESNLDSLTLPSRPFFASKSSTSTTESITRRSDQLSVISELSSEQYTYNYQ